VDARAKLERREFHLGRSVRNTAGAGAPV